MLDAFATLTLTLGFPGGSEGKASACNAGDLGSIPGSVEDPLEKEMAAHSSTLAWKTPWTEKPGRLQSMGSQRVGHDLEISPSLKKTRCEAWSFFFLPWLIAGQRPLYKLLVSTRLYFSYINKSIP